MSIESKKPGRSRKQSVTETGNRYIASGVAIQELFERLQMTGEDRRIVNAARFAAIEFGAAAMADQIREKSVIQAAIGRKKIGTESRGKVAKAAEKYMHLSRGNAAHEIASIVNLDTGTVRRYLSELFPGEKWKRRIE